MAAQDIRTLIGGTQQTHSTRIVVKFDDAIALPYVDGAERFLPPAEKAAWDGLARTFPGITLQRLYTVIDGERIRELVQLAQEQDPTYNPPNLLSYFVIIAPTSADPNTVAAEAKGIVNADIATPLPVIAPANPPATIVADRAGAAISLGMDANDGSDGSDGDEHESRPSSGKYVDHDELAQELCKLPSVQNAYVELPSNDPGGGINLVTAPLISQGYLDQAPDGINARFAWRHGGDGSGMRLIDIEQGWTLDHEALAAHQIKLTGGQLNDDVRYHGTAVLGVICAAENQMGVLGIAPKTDPIRVISYLTSIGQFPNVSTTNSLPDAIMAAIVQLVFDDLGSFLVGRFGDVLLLEAQLAGLDIALNGIAIEYHDAEFETIRLATALGIVVIEAAGNNGSSLDGLPQLNRMDGAAKGFRDSGAIMVGAAAAETLDPTPGVGWIPWINSSDHSQGTNYGSRVDCYAWGENITTSCSRTLQQSGKYNPCDTSNSNVSDNYTINDYSFSFRGTSGASAIIAGVALALQSGAQASLGHRYRPRELRAILSDANNGTRSRNWPNDGIGVMPDLKAIFIKELIASLFPWQGNEPGRQLLADALSNL